MALFCVADEFAEVAVLVFDEDGQHLLPGLPPTDLSASTATLGALEDRLTRLISAGPAGVRPVPAHWTPAYMRFKTSAEREQWLREPHPPRVDLCIKAYTIASPNGPQRRFRLFNSILV